MEKVEWPSWRYGPEGQSQVFQSEDDVPAGWADHPSKVSPGVAESADGGAPVPFPEADRQAQTGAEPVTAPGQKRTQRKTAREKAEGTSAARPASLETQPSQLGQARKDFKAIFGKQPNPRMTLEAINEAIAKEQAGNPKQPGEGKVPPPPQPETAPAAKRGRGRPAKPPKLDL